ncbi:nuclear transport factor 2 family protein [Nitrobacter sp.]|uniref:nuclear transport factor 2 family protein n=1 Tax=Nitrobacter sp. TaxID=29420 RepID=UPI0029CABA71|nr:nuclear transport factor 2 family protein [Nitrobacter sp.]
MTEQTTDLSAILARLDKLEAKEQIRAAIARYSKGVDRTDPTQTHQTMWPDARLILQYIEGTAKDFVDPLIGEYVEKVLRGTHHMMGNTIIDLDGDTARTETYALAHHRSYPTSESNAAMMGAQNIPAGGENKQLELIIGLRYLDHFERRDGVWKIIERRLVFDWSQLGEYSGIEEGGLYDGTLLRGERKQKDSSYNWDRAA